MMKRKNTIYAWTSGVAVLSLLVVAGCDRSERQTTEQQQQPQVQPQRQVQPQMPAQPPAVPAERPAAAAGDAAAMPSPAAAGAADAAAQADRAKAAGGGIGMPFEGEIEMRITSAKARAPQPISFSIKGDQVRYDIDKSENFSEPVYGVLDVSDRKMTVVSDATKNYTTIDLSQIPRPSKEQVKSRAQTAAANWDVRNTGTQDKVAGMTCNVWEVTKVNSKAKSSACLADNLPRFDLERVIPAGWLPNTWSDYLDQAAFPLRVRNFDDQGKEVLSAEVTSISIKEIDQKLFTGPPADYKKTSVRERLTRGLPTIPGVPEL